MLWVCSCPNAAVLPLLLGYVCLHAVETPDAVGRTRKEIIFILLPLFHFDFTQSSCLGAFARYATALLCFVCADAQMLLSCCCCLALCACMLLRHQTPVAAFMPRCLRQIHQLVMVPLRWFCWVVLLDISILLWCYCCWVLAACMLLLLHQMSRAAFIASVHTLSLRLLGCFA